jgi:hypothetical protein
MTVSGPAAPVELPFITFGLSHFGKVAVNKQLGRLIRLLCEFFRRLLHSRPFPSTLLNPLLVFNLFQPK